MRICFSDNLPVRLFFCRLFLKFYKKIHMKTAAVLCVKLYCEFGTNSLINILWSGFAENTKNDVIRDGQQTLLDQGRVFLFYLKAVAVFVAHVSEFCLVFVNFAVSMEGDWCVDLDSCFFTFGKDNSFASFVFSEFCKWN